MFNDDNHNAFRTAWNNALRNVGGKTGKVLDLHRIKDIESQSDTKDSEGASRRQSSLLNEADSLRLMSALLDDIVQKDGGRYRFARNIGTIKLLL